MNETAEIIENAMTPRGAWTRATLAEWGIAWPPRRGWKRDLIARDALATTSRRSVSPMSDTPIPTEIEDAYRAGYVMALRNTITSLEATIEQLLPQFVGASEGDDQEDHDHHEQNGVNASDPSE